MARVLKNPTPEPVLTVPHDLCQLLHFVPQVFVKDGVSYIGWMSRHPTLVTNEARSSSGIGDCKHICATLVYNRGLGGLQLAIRTHGLQCVGGYAVARGELRFLLHGVLRGTVTIWSSDTSCQEVVAAESGDPPAGTVQNCGTDVHGCVDNGAGYGSPPTRPINSLCHYLPPYGIDCLYCVGNEDQTECSIETDQRCTPCGTEESLGHGFAPPGARITPAGPIGGAHPQQSSHDLFMDDRDFNANDGAAALVRYYLKGFRGLVWPVFPDRTFGGGNILCCTWLCNWMVNYGTEKAWKLFCNAPRQVPFPQTLTNQQKIAPRFFTIDFGDRICFIHFNFANLGGGCFQLRDQFCFTAGTELPLGVVDYWAHLNDGDTRLILLDSLRVSLNMRFATDTAKYRFKEPECQRICDDAISGVRNFVEQRQVLRPGGPNRHYKYDDPGLNTWFKDTGWPDCSTAPAVRQGGTGAPWTVYVTPYGTNCRFPADLIYRRVVTTLHLSVERATLGFINAPRGIRAVATFRCVVFLHVRLRPGWENIPCPVPLPFHGPCDPSYINLDDTLVLSSDGCSTVPLMLEWRGMQAPRPWSKGPCLFQTPNTNGGCCDALSVIDGLVIPGEVNNFGSPDSAQVFGGDVVVGLIAPPSSVGC